MELDYFSTYCLTKKGAEKTYPFGDQALWFKVGGKAFAWTFVKEFKFGNEIGQPFKFINLKCEPNKALDLRKQHRAIQPGWHQNKKHWNSIFIDQTISDQLILSLIDHSYQIVFDSLSKALKAALTN